MPALVAYARAKNVGIILWAVWKTLADQIEPALAQFEEWGIKGIKVDFMQRDDQQVIDFYHRVAREAAKRKMLVDFHGGQRPALMTRTWPNIISTEGVKGLEHHKWSDDADPEHNVTLPFTRMFLGPMDYTPGAMLNATREDLQAGVQGAHEPGHALPPARDVRGLREPAADAGRFAHQLPARGGDDGVPAPVPTVWDETRVLDGRIGDYVVVARRKGQDWFVGAMTDWTPRELEIDLRRSSRRRRDTCAWTWSRSRTVRTPIACRPATVARAPP